MSSVVVIGGLPRSLVNFRGALLEAMYARGHEVIACASGEDAETQTWLSQRAMCYVALPLERTGMNPLSDVRLLLTLIDLIRQLRPEVVLGYTVKPVVYGMLAARINGIPGCYALITGLGGAFMEPHTFKQRLASWIVPLLYRLALRGCRVVFFQNDDDRRLFSDRGLLQKGVPAIKVNGSGIDLEHFQPAPLPAGPVVFLLIARLLREKGIREYVDAAWRAKEQFPDACFQLVGPYDPQPSAIKQAELDSWTASGTIEYFGETQDVRPFLAQCTVYVLPSYREGTPRSVLEAMAMARPIITTNVPGCRETVEEGRNGFLVPARDAGALAAAMCRLLRAPELLPSMSIESRRLAQERFDVRRVNQVMLDTMGL